MKSSGFSMSLGAKPPPPKKPPAAVKPRSQLSGGDDESDGEDIDQIRSQVQQVSGFNKTKGAIALDDGGSRKKSPLVIPAIKNKDWREESLKRKRQVWLPPEARQKKAGDGGAGEDNSEVVGGNTGIVGQEGYGLQVMDKSDGDDTAAGGGGGGGGGGGDIKAVNGGDGNVTIGEEEEENPTKPQTEDDIALEALISGEGSKKKSNLILAPTNLSNLDWRESRAQMALQNETDAYKADIAHRPDAPSLDAYDAVPVEEFGAALLRGMGWKEGMQLGKGARGKKADSTGGKAKVVEKRPALLGLGAKTKEQAFGGELGAWGKGEKPGGPGGKKKSAWVDKTYVPVVLRNKVTGEIVDTPPPAPLSRKGGGNGGGDDGKDSSSRNGNFKGREAELRDLEKPSSRRERGDGEDTDQSEKRRRRGEDRDRDRSRDRRRDGDKDRRNYDSSRYQRDKESDGDSRRDRDRDRDRGSRRDRDRDSGKDYDRDRDRDRDGNRDRDRERDRDRDRERERRRERGDDYDRRRRSRERR